MFQNKNKQSDVDPILLDCLRADLNELRSKFDLLLDHLNLEYYEMIEIKRMGKKIESRRTREYRERKHSKGRPRKRK